MKSLKKLVLVSLIVTTISSCAALKYVLTQGDAIAGVKELLTNGILKGAGILSKDGAYSGDTFLNAMMPPEYAKAVKLLNDIGLGKEVSKFTNTLTQVAAKTAERSGGMFLEGIKRMDIGDAIGIVKGADNAATTYFKGKIGDSLKLALKPVVASALDEYKVNDALNKLLGPVKLLGNTFKPDLNGIVSGLVTNAMFNKVEEVEKEIRTKAEARTSDVLKKVFGSAAERVTGGILK